MPDYQLYQQPGAGPQAPPPGPPPRQPRKNPYADGLSQSAQHYDLFEMIRHPNVSKNCRPPDPPPRPLVPTLSKQKRIEQEVEQKFNENRAANGGTFIPLAAQLTKYFFLGCILPFYLILYRLPKFLLVDWVVALAQFTDRKLKEAALYIQRAYERRKLKIKNGFKNFWYMLKGKFHRRHDTKPETEDLSFVAFLAEGLVAFYRFSLHPIFKIIRALWKYSQASYQWLRLLPHRLHQFIQQSKQKVRMLCEWMEEGLKKIYSFSKQAVTGSLRPPAQWVDRQLEALTNKFKQLAQLLKLYGKKMVFVVRHPYKTVEQLQQRLHQRYIQFKKYLAKTREKWSFLWLKRKALWHRTYLQPIKRQFQAFAAGFKRQMKKVQSPFLKLMHILRSYKPTIKIKSPQFIKNYRPQNWTPLLKYQQVLRFIKIRVAKFYAKINQFVEKIEAKITEKLTPLFRGINFILKKLTFLKRVSLPFYRAFQKINNVLESLSYRLRRMIAWTHVLYRYGFARVVEVTETLF